MYEFPPAFAVISVIALPLFLKAVVWIQPLLATVMVRDVVALPPELDAVTV